ncbi:pyruvate, phosphate dikinase [Micromonospora sp. CPCC 205561]|uniref:pyruvate, phosphate dikinase n=1 Tax=Micromonospora sp. CPCC 205561 TaxID=3122407 RepID=UPI002FF300C9
MSWIHPLSAGVDATADVLGGKGHGLVVLRRLGLPVPPGFVIGTAAGRAFLRDGRLPDGLEAELAGAVAGLEADTRRRLGAARRPLVVSVRSGAAVAMPGMMSTVLGVGLTGPATAALAAETGDPRFALDSRLRFLSSFAGAVVGVAPERLDALARGAAGRADGGPEPRLAEAVGRVEALVRERAGDDVPDDAGRQLRLAVEAVLSSWNTPRARTYRELHGIAHDLGTAVTVQAMVFGNRDGHSGAGVAFSRDPNTGEPVARGEVLFGGQGDDVVAGRSTARPLAELAEREPAAWAELLAALARVERHHRDACGVEFTVESGRLWLLQMRPGGLVGRAAVRVAVDLADEGLIDRREALLRLSARHLGSARTPRIEAAAGVDVFLRGLGACLGVAAGRVATTAERAVAMAADGPVILVRPHTSPLDMHGLAAAAGVVTASGGPASHAAVVARAMGKPAVVGAAELRIDVPGGRVRAGGRALPEGTLVTVDGTGGVVVVGAPRVVTAPDEQLHRLLGWADEVSGGDPTRTDAERLAAAHAVLKPA